MADRSLFPPTTIEDIQARGWDQPDFVYVCGDAYVDHPSFGAAVITRVLENAGWRIAVLAQPNWENTADFKRFGRPRFGFLVSSGVIDSMVNHYTAAKRKRSSDVYTPGGAPAARPDRAVTVYCRCIRKLFGDIPIAIGGVEASLRRFAHYDYWDDRVRPSILCESGADILMFGMGERTVCAVADWMSRGAPIWECTKMRGICFKATKPPHDSLVIPSFETCSEDTPAGRRKYAEAFFVQYKEQDPFRGPAFMLLSAGKKVQATSFIPGHEPEKAVEENVQTWWKAGAAGPRECLTLDLGKCFDVHAVQINFADDALDIPCPGEIRPGSQARYIEEADTRTRYLLEGSSDGENWKVLVDKRQTETDLSHDFTVFDEIQTIAVTPDKKTVIQVITDGYSKDGINILVGFDAQGSISGIEFVSLGETPGLGSKVRDEADFRKQFYGLSQPSDSFDAVSGATFSSNGMKHAVDTALKAYNENKEAILGG